MSSRCWSWIQEAQEEGPQDRAWNQDHQC
jgi:hypothetical protein